MRAASKGRQLGIASIVVASVLWGTTGVSATFAPNVSPIAIGAVAMGGGGILQALVALPSLLSEWRKLQRLFPCLLLGGAAVAVYPLAFYSSMHMAGVTIGTVVTIGSAPLFSAVIEWLVDKVRLSAVCYFSILLGVVGIILLSMGQASHLVDTSGSQLMGIALGLLGGLSYALYSWLIGQVMHEPVSRQAVMGSVFGIGGICLLPVIYMTGHAFLVSTNAFCVGAYMALVPMFLGYAAFGFGLSRIDASQAIILTLIEPVVAAVLALIVVGERISPIGWLGVLCIFSCLLCVTLEPMMKSRVEALFSQDHVPEE